MPHSYGYWIAAAFVLAARFVVADPAVGAGKAPSTRPIVPTTAQANPPAVKFFGNDGHGRRILFLCEFDGGSFKTFDLLRVELHYAIESLVPSQSFGILFFPSSKSAAEMGLIPATKENKRVVLEALDRLVHISKDDPLSSIKAGLELKPDLVYFLIDPTDFPDKRETLEAFRAANADKKMKVNTIAFIDRDPMDEKFLKQLADENGGTYLYVSEDAIDRRKPPVK